ncbi:choline ABC transporter ATP-binding protein [Sphingomonas profundi]|uniref:choline ABC transporter ATP-binding protein n=1 Tax=Alterirhizorhabdus profundi TaxID=2681549 RepID=UPI0012E95128|nr:choline ABC transporter ATP-binding protein [Sphingomonas profundi]
MTVALEFRDVAILFCSATGRRRHADLAAAQALADAGADRAKISSETGVVLGVTGASLAVEEGTISVLMGLSGSGKSTLLRAANGLNKVTRGHVLVRDGMGAKDVADCSEGVLRHIRRHRVAMVFQQFGLLPWRTVRENVAFGLELRGTARAETARIVDERLALVGLEGWANRYASELSGGMQQRVGLARAFSTDADILLMDEPFSALDPLIRAKLQDELLSLQQQVKKTILFVSHDLDEALKLGDRVTLLEGGRIIQSGTAEDIVLRPATPYVAEFVRHMNPLNVMTGETVMRPAHALATRDGATLLDDEARYRIASAGPIDTVAIDGVPHPVTHFTDPDNQAQFPAGIVACPAGVSVRTLIRVLSTSDHPILLTEGGRLVGVCATRDVMRALGPNVARQ